MNQFMVPYILKKLVVLNQLRCFALETKVKPPFT